MINQVQILYLITQQLVSYTLCIYKSKLKLMKPEKYPPKTYVSEEHANKLIKMAKSKIKDQDLLHRGFLKPIEIALKTYKTQMNFPDCKLKPTSMAAGLKIAVKQKITNNKYDLQDIIPIQNIATTSFEEIQANNQDNILTLMKQITTDSRVEGLELAICVCMYSQDKKMLKSTLSGVAQNISNIVTRAKISSDKIGVFVMMDGIQKVDSSVIDYFEELERSNNINLGENVANPLTVEQMMKRAQTMTEQQINQEEMKNVNNILFDPAQLQERNERRFAKVRSEHDSIKQLLKEIEVLKKKKNPLFDDLPNKLRPFFVQQAKQLRKKQYDQTDEQIKLLSQEKILAEYVDDVKRVKPIIMKALQDGQRYCHQYINSRQDLAYLACFRNKVYHSLDKLPPNIRQNKYMQHGESAEFVDQIAENQFFTYMNLFLCVKYKNSGKLSSHNWFFNGFCRQLQPKYAVLLDVGLRPDDEALFKMYKYMKSHANIGGVCGYMSLKIEQLQPEQQINDQDVDFLTSISLKFADIQRTQQVEYHFSHLMDKPFEASFGFIHVLPGAFSAYNMEAIIKYDDKQDDELLKSYFKSIDQKLKNNKIIPTQLSKTSLFLRTLLPDIINNCCINIDPQSDQQMLYNENIYLAEDRILCMGIHKKGKDMAYLPDAYAEVDPIKSVHALLGQRKRWINGSFFAFQKVKKELSQHEKQNGYEFCLHIQMVYLTIMNSLSYFAPSLFLFTVDIAMQAFRADVLTKVLGGVVNDPNNSQFYNSFVYTIDFIYVMLIFSIVFFSLHLTNNNKKYKPYLYAVSTLLGVFSICVFAVLVVDVFRGLIDNAAFLIENEAMAGDIPGGIATIDVLRWILIGSTLIYVIPILVYVFLFNKPNILCEIILGAFSFLFYGPTYLNILNIYSLCRVDDISWGTKGLDTGSSQSSNLKQSWKLIKYVHVSKYVIWNIIISVILLSFGSNYSPRFFITIIMVGIMAFSLSFKIIIGIFYMIKYKMMNCRCCQKEDQHMLRDPSVIRETLDKFKPHIWKEIDLNLNGIKNAYINDNYGKLGSFIQAAKSKKNVQKSFQKKNKLDQIRASKIVKPPTNLKFGQSRVPRPQQPSYRPVNNPQIAQTASDEQLSSPQKGNTSNQSQGFINHSKNKLPPPEQQQQKVDEKTFSNNFKKVQKNKQKKFQKK